MRELLMMVMDGERWRTCTCEHSHTRTRIYAYTHTNTYIYILVYNFHNNIALYVHMAFGSRAIFGGQPDRWFTGGKTTYIIIVIMY